MNYKISTLAVVLAVVAGGAFVATPTAHAACSWNGYYNSNGNCGVSWKKDKYQYTNQYQYQYSNQTAMLQAYIRQLEALLERLRELQRDQDYDYDYGNGRSDVDVTTLRATDIDGEDATLNGEVDFNDENEATVYFRWGTSAGNLSRETTNIVLDADEDDERFAATITNLDEDKTYYFRAVAEDENGDRAYGAILSFRSDDDGEDDGDGDDDYEDYPEVDTEDALNITDSTAKLYGEVAMEDFNNGTVFFVYGEDEDQVEGIENDYDTYEDVDEDGDDLQKIFVDGDLDDSREYWASIAGLNDDTEIFYTLCVAFEDEDGDEVIRCGEVESFVTDED